MAIVVIVALGFVSMILSNFWDELSGTDGFSDFADSMPMTGYFLDYYLISVLLMGFTTLMVGFSRGGGF